MRLRLRVAAAEPHERRREGRGGSKRWCWCTNFLATAHGCWLPLVMWVHRRVGGLRVDARRRGPWLDGHWRYVWVTLG